MLILLHYFLHSIAEYCVDKESDWAISAVLGVHTLKEPVLRTADNPLPSLTSGQLDCWFNIHCGQMRTLKKLVPDFSQ